MRVGRDNESELEPEWRKDCEWESNDVYIKCHLCKTLSFRPQNTSQWKCVIQYVYYPYVGYC